MIQWLTRGSWVWVGLSVWAVAFHLPQSGWGRGGAGFLEIRKHGLHLHVLMPVSYCTGMCLCVPLRVCTHVRLFPCIHASACMWVCEYMGLCVLPQFLRTCVFVTSPCVIVYSCLCVCLYAPSCVCLCKCEHAQGKNRERRREADIWIRACRGRRICSGQGLDMFLSLPRMWQGNRPTGCPIRASRKGLWSSLSVQEVALASGNKAASRAQKKPSEASKGLPVALPRGTGSVSPVHESLESEEILAPPVNLWARN